MTLYEGCCGDDSWRGRHCQYHQGYEDGLYEGAAPFVPLMTRFTRLRPEYQQIFAHDKTSDEDIDNARVFLVKIGYY